jgi:hypothetical protein
MKNNDKTKLDSTVEDIKDNPLYRVMIDLKADGNAEGGKFATSPEVRIEVEKIESKGVDKVVGFVYDGTDRLEIITQPLEDAKKIDVVLGKKLPEPNDKV